MTDIINSLFEGIGSLLVWRNVYILLRDREVKGVDWRVQGFWAMWGIWNIQYYYTVGHPLSCAAGAFLACGNITWVTIAARLSGFHPLLWIQKKEQEYARDKA